MCTVCGLLVFSKRAHKHTPHSSFIWHLCLRHITALPHRRTPTDARTSGLRSPAALHPLPFTCTSPSSPGTKRVSEPASCLLAPRSFYIPLPALPSTALRVAPPLSLRPARAAAMGQKPTEEELFQMISEVDDNMSGSIGKVSCFLRGSLGRTV